MSCVKDVTLSSTRKRTAPTALYSMTKFVKAPVKELVKSCFFCTNTGSSSRQTWRSDQPGINHFIADFCPRVFVDELFGIVQGEVAVDLLLRFHLADTQRSPIIVIHRVVLLCDLFENAFSVLFAEEFNE